MPDYYAMGHEQLKERNPLGVDLSTAEAKVIGARFQSYSPCENPVDVINVYVNTEGIGAIPEGAFVMLLEYSLGNGSSRRYTSKRHTPTTKVILFDKSNGKSIEHDLGVSRTKDLEGKIVEALLQHGSLVGIRV